MEEDKPGAEIVIDKYIGSVAKLSLPRLPTVTNNSTRNGSNVKPTRDLNVKNNESTDCVIDDPPKNIYSSRNPEPGKKTIDYTDYLVVDDYCLYDTMNK